MASWDRRNASEERRIQGRLLERWLAAVSASAPYWQRHLEAAGIKPAKVDRVERLRAIPPVREVDVLGAGGSGAPALVLRPTEADVKARGSAATLLRVASDIRASGAAGKRQALLEEFKPIHLHEAGRDGDLAIAYSRSDLDRLHRTGARAAAVLGLTSDDYLVSAVPSSPTLQFWGLYHLALGASVLAVHARGHRDDLRAVARAWPLVPATAVAVRTGEAADLAHTLRGAGIGAGRVRTVVLAGPPPSPEDRAAIADAWQQAGARPDVRVLAVWAPTSNRAVWAECSPDSGLHVYPDLEVVEVLDPTTGAPTDGRGDLTVTSVGWHGTVLVRYQTGDEVEGLATGACRNCGHTVPRVNAPVTQGAWEPVADTGGAQVRLDLRGATAVLEPAPDVSAWRVELRRTRSGDGYVVELAGELDGPRLVEIDRTVALAVGLEPAQLVLAERDAVAAAPRFSDTR